MDTLGHLLAVPTSPANGQDRAQVHDLCLEVQEATGVTVEVAYAVRGSTGKETALQAASAGVELVVKRSEATKGFILLPERWVAERSFAWLSRFRRLGRNLERLSITLIGFHFVAACLLLATILKPLFAALAGELLNAVVSPRGANAHDGSNSIRLALETWARSLLCAP